MQRMMTGSGGPQVDSKAPPEAGADAGLGQIHTGPDIYPIAKPPELRC